MEYAQIHTIILSVVADGDDGISESRAVELVREMALRAVDRAVAEERAAVVAWLRETDGPPDGNADCEEALAYAAGAIGRGEHRREEKP